VQPSRYAHLVDQGTRHAKPHPFRAPALDASKAQFVAAFTAKLRQLVESGLPER
jgi:hypothetical protein